MDRYALRCWTVGLVLAAAAVAADSLRPTQRLADARPQVSPRGVVGREERELGAEFDAHVGHGVVVDIADVDEADAARAIRNLARLCRGVLFFSALTRRDWRENADQSRTDRRVAMRTARWYRERLARHFRQIGAGFWIRRGAPLVTWELESAV